MFKDSPLVVLIGPTAIGKSQVAIEMAGMLSGEVVSADSMQVYRGLDIGTAKVPPAERLTRKGQVIPHHLLDVVDPREDFTVATYQRLAREALTQIRQRGKVPLLVGGSGLYVRAVVDGFQFPPRPRDNGLRQRLSREAEAFGSASLHRRLAAVDPEAACAIDPEDTKRVVRALEVYLSSGRPASQARGRQDPPEPVLLFGLTTARATLYRRIDERVEQMLAQGLVAEVQGLLRQGCTPQLRAMQGLGYRHVTAYLRGQTTLAEATRLLKRDTRHFAKRQLTWFGRDQRICWFDTAEFPDAWTNAAAIASLIGRRMAADVEKP